MNSSRTSTSAASTPPVQSTPAHSPNCGWGSAIARPIAGYRKTASVPNSVIVATAYATSRARAPITGAVATIAVLPQTAEPTAMSTARRLSTRTTRDARRTIANEMAIVTTIRPVAGRPICAISARLSRAPSRMMPSRSTRCDAKRRPGSKGRRRGPAADATTMPRSSATETSATMDGRNPVTSRATAATAIAAASPGTTDRVPSAIADGRLRTVRDSGREPAAPPARPGGRGGPHRTARS